MEFQTTGLVEGATCMCESFLFCFFSGWGRASTLLTFRRALLLRQKKRTKKTIFRASHKILKIFKFKKRGRLFILGLVVQKKSLKMIYCLTFVINNAKKKNVFYPCEAICMQNPTVSSRQNHDVPSISFPLFFFIKTVLDNLTSAHHCSRCVRGRGSESGWEITS